MAKLFTKGYWQQQDLLKYSTSRGGNMNGNSKRTALTIYDENKVLLTFSDADYHYQEPTVKEYLVDRKILSDIKDIFIKYGMYNWQGKKFSKFFVCDGETTSYSFYFSEDDISFSSQIYSKQYSDKLAQINQIIEMYRAKGEKSREAARLSP